MFSSQLETGKQNSPTTEYIIKMMLHCFFPSNYKHNTFSTSSDTHVTAMEATTHLITATQDWFPSHFFAKSLLETRETHVMLFFVRLSCAILCEKETSMRKEKGYDLGIGVCSVVDHGV